MEDLCQHLLHHCRFAAPCCRVLFSLLALCYITLTGQIIKSVFTIKNTAAALTVWSEFLCLVVEGKLLVGFAALLSAAEVQTAWGLNFKFPSLLLFFVKGCGKCTFFFSAFGDDKSSVLQTTSIKNSEHLNRLILFLNTSHCCIWIK